MKKNLAMLTFAALLLISSQAFGAIYTFSTDAFSPLNGGMNHEMAYTWGLETPWAQDEDITGATLTFSGIYNWRAEENYLYLNLRDEADLGVTSFADPSSGFEDYFDSLDTHIATWSDPIGGYPNRTTLVYDFEDLGILDEFLGYANDGSFGFAFDPDCHYYVIDEVTLVVKGAIPEPGTIALLGLGLTGLGLIIRRK